MTEKEIKTLSLVKNHKNYSTYNLWKQAILKKFEEMNANVSLAELTQKIIFHFISDAVPKLVKKSSDTPDIAAWYENDALLFLEGMISKEIVEASKCPEIVSSVCEYKSNLYFSWLEQFNQLGCSGIARACCNLAVAYGTLLKSPEEKLEFALSMLDDLLKDLENIKENSYCDIASRCSIVSKLFRDLGDFARAIQVLKIAVDLRKQLKKENSQDREDKNINTIIDFEVDILLMEENLKKLEESINQHAENIEESRNEEEKNILSEVANFFNDKGAQLSVEQNYKCAEKFFLLSITFRKKIPNDFLSNDDKRSFKASELYVSIAAFSNQLDSFFDEDEEDEKIDEKSILEYYKSANKSFTEQSSKVLINLRIQQKNLLDSMQGKSEEQDGEKEESFFATAIKCIQEYISKIDDTLWLKIREEYPKEKMEKWLGTDFFNDNNSKKRKNDSSLDINYKKIKLN